MSLTTLVAETIHLNSVVPDNGLIPSQYFLIKHAEREVSVT